MRDLVFLLEPAFHGAPYIRTALDLGCEVVVLRRENGPVNPCPQETTTITVDVESPGRVIDVVRANIFSRGGRAAILPGNEWMVPIAARVAHMLGFRGNPPYAALAARDKLNMRLAFMHAGVDCPRLLQVHFDLDSVKAGASSFTGPVIVKPADMACSYLVRLAKSPAELIEQARLILSTRKQSCGYISKGIVLVEEFAIGPEYSVEVFLHEGRGVFASVTMKEKGDLPHFVELGHVVPAPIPRETAELLRVAAVSAATSLGLRYGPCHVEVILANGKPKIVELAARLGGDNITELLRLAGTDADGKERTNLHRAALLQALGDDNFDCLEPPRRGAAIRFLTAAPGVVESVRPPVTRTHQYQLPACGYSVSDLRSSDDRLGYVIAVAESGATARDLAHKAASEVEIRTMPQEGLSVETVSV